MVIATGIKRFLDRHRVVYRPIMHELQQDLFGVAQSLHIDAGEILQALPLTDSYSALLAVLPLNQALDYQRLREKYRTIFNPMSFEKANKTFWDCEPGSYPPFGLPYGLKVILDKRIVLLKQVYFVGGSRQSLIKMSVEDFRFLNADAPFFGFSYPNGFAAHSSLQPPGIDRQLAGPMGIG